MKSFPKGLVLVFELIELPAEIARDKSVKEHGSKLF